MPLPVIGQSGAAPGSDGDVNLYINAEGRTHSWFSMQRRVVFVNGMANSPEDHKKSALALSLLQACPVIGVYNRTDGFWSDLGQCIADKITLVGAQAHSFSGWKMAVDAAYVAANALNPALTKIDFVGKLVEGNRATHSLYQLVANQTQASRHAMKIFSHSQGNLITSNALTAVALALGIKSIAGMEVNSFGSPCRYWPEGLNRTNNAFTFDPVSWLDYNIGFDSVKVGFTPGLFAHGFDIYLSQDAEFVVNRFRWGSFRMTASMDEDGLARYLVRMGNNPPRVKAIFQWLYNHHNSDSDDVAEIYCRLMRTQHASTLAAICRADRTLRDLLIRCLNEGVTFAGERREIEHLRTL